MMLLNKDQVVCFLLLWALIYNVRCQNIEKMSKTLDEILIGTRSFRRPRDYEDTSLVWQEYDFDTETGNREEVVVTNISLHRYLDIPENVDWQFLQTEHAYFIRAENTTLLPYKINLNDFSIESNISITTEGHILLFKVLNLVNVEDTKRENHVNDLMAVLLVETQNGHFLYWFRIIENTYILYSTLPIQKQIQDMKFVQERNQYELLLLDNDNAHAKGQSLIDIYGFIVDYTNHRIDIWFCQRLHVPKIFDIQVCSVYGNTVLALQEIDNIALYGSKNEQILCQFEKLQVIKSNKLTNFVCFESGHIEYLAIAGKEPRFLHFFENEFQDNNKTDLHFNETSEIFWITAIPLNTYRDESLLLVQLKNSTVIALAWQGSKYKSVPLPNQIIDNFDLSKIVVIPQVGFVYGNTFVRIELILKELTHPIHDETESVLKTQALLEEVFRKQEAIFNETEALLNQSYYNNPVTIGSWNFSKLDVSNATIQKDVNYGAIKISSIDLKMEDMSINVTSVLRELEEIGVTLDQVLPNLENVANINSTRITLSSNVEIIGDFLINGTLYAKDVTAAIINNVSTTNSFVASNIVNQAVNVVIKGQKLFPYIDANNLIILALNGILLEEIVFDIFITNYSDVDFSKLKRLEVDGLLNFSEINDIDWKNLMQNIVWKGKSAIIPGETIMETQLLAEDVNVEKLNNLLYPYDYVLINDRYSTYITGAKYFSNLSVTHLFGVNTINKIDIDDFIILSRHENISQEIIFEDLEIDGTLQIDGDLTGINIDNIEVSLEETNTLLSDVIFENLIVYGDIVLQDTINSKTWSDFDDILLKTEKSAVINGNKKFLNGVNLKCNVTIKSGLINGHEPSEFVTLETDQFLPNLKKISANIIFGDVTLGSIKKLEDFITREQYISSGCLNKILLFTKSPIIDDLSFNTLKQTISQTVFFDKLNQTFQTGHFENLILSALMANEILPNTINGAWDYTDLAKYVLTAFTQQNLTGSLILENLETVAFDAEIINGMTMNEFNRLLKHAKSLYNDILNRNASMESLQVTGIITASSINKHDMLNIYKEDSMATVIFNKNVSIGNLTVVGFVNGLNLFEFVADAVQRANKNVTFINRKTFENVTCKFLEARFINGHFVDDILDSDREQVLKGPVVINGSITVLESFDIVGKIGNLFFHEFTNRFMSLENNSYILHGNFCFIQKASITEVDVNGPIQGLVFNSFLQVTIYKNDANVTISGTKLFDSPVAFHNAFIIDGSLNDLNLHRFHEKAVYTDKHFSIDSKVVFKENVYISKNLLVKMKLQSYTIMGVHILDLQENVIALNKPRYFPAQITLADINFKSGVKVTQVNDLQMDLLIPLHTIGFIMVDGLNCTNATIKNIQALGRINNYILDKIYADTFMIYGNQNITGTINIQGNVYAYHDFNALFINSFNPKQIIPLIVNDTLTGNFMFKDLIVLDKSLRILGCLNGIRPINWQGIAVKRMDEIKQIISGNWRVHGNIHFEGDVEGSEFLNGINIIAVSTTLAEELAEIDRIVEEVNETLNNTYEDLNVLKCNAINQIYKFNTFDYIKILEFEGDIHDIHNIELNDVNYLLVNYEYCHMKLLQYTSTNFEVIDEKSDFGLIDRWIFFKSNSAIYIFTIAKQACGRSLNNIWKLENNKLMHVLELGNATDAMNIYQDIFVTMNYENVETSPENVQSDISEVPFPHEIEKLDTILNNDPIVLSNQSLIYRLQERSSNNTHLRNCVGCSSLLNFKVGISERQEYIYYDEKISQDYIYLYRNDISQTKILQTIKALRPKSFLVLNFDGFIETLFIFVENNQTIQIYQYQGIEGFVYRNTIKMKVDRLYNFKTGKYINSKKTHYLIAVSGNRLTILEAKMYGEKLNLQRSAMDSFYNNTCRIR